MPPAYRLINYALRPAKYVERRMICEALRRLSKVAALESYRYVGFGSVYFSDFVLMHKELNVGPMLSIEEKVGDSPRFEFNKPYHNIEMRYGRAVDVLPELDWNDLSIVWLDYESALNLEVLGDVETVVSQVRPGSVLLVTVHADHERSVRGRAERLRERLGRGNVPRNVSDESLGGSGTADVYWRILDATIRQVLRDRNGGLGPSSTLRYDQVFHFRYRDNALMLSSGGIIYEVGQAPHVMSCDFDAVTCVRRGEEPYELRIPNLTLREMRYLDQRLPPADSATGPLASPGLPSEDAKAYASVYRYIPGFVHSDL